MHFLPDVYVPCEQCDGKRYNRETLEVRFKGKTIADVLEMPVEEALDFFQPHPEDPPAAAGAARRRARLHPARPAGDDAVGRRGAARQARDASCPRSRPGRTLYILDEPTTGLHFADVQRLLEMLQRLVDQGNTVVVIEHNLDVIKTADRIIDLGPEGGEEGGTIVATGTPEQVAATAGSYTGRFLADLVHAEEAPARSARARTERQASANGCAKLPAAA